MTVDQLRERLRSLERAGRITGDTEVVVRDPAVSDGAWEAGSDPWTDLEEVLVPDSTRIVLSASLD